MEERLQKIIAQSGLCSRRAAEELILQGKVRVNGHTITELGSKADPSTDSIVVNNKPLPKPPVVVYAVNKPRGMVCSKVQQGKAPIITSITPAFPPVFPVGRLDKDSEGLIIVTNDGSLANQLTHPSFKHEKEYLVIGTPIQPDAKLDPEELERKLSNGIYLKDGKVTVHRPKVRLQEDGMIRLRLTISVGRHHVIRRVCARLGIDVKRLQRVRINKLLLDKLQPGTYKFIGKEELRLLTAR